MRLEWNPHTETAPTRQPVGACETPGKRLLTNDRLGVLEAAASNTAEHFGRQLSELRKKAGLTQREVATAMGVGQQRISAIKHGTDITTKTLARYATALGGRLYGC